MCKACNITEEERNTLTELICKNCEFIAKIESFPAVKLLEVSGCKNLHTIFLPNNKIYNMNISNCPNIRALRTGGNIFLGEIRS